MTTIGFLMTRQSKEIGNERKARQHFQLEVDYQIDERAFEL